MNDYFLGTINQLIDRAKHLNGRLPAPRDLPPHAQTLVQTCRQEVKDTIAELRELLEDPNLLLPSSQSIRLRRLRRLVEELDTLESLGVAALTRWGEDDAWLTRLVHEIACEADYPLTPPVVTSLSRDYFHIYIPLNLLYVPLIEGHFLLHLPDLYHELGHPLLTEQDNPKIEPWQTQFVVVLTAALNRLDEEIQKAERRGDPIEHVFRMHRWKEAWIRGWAVEFFCDLFATFALGPAYAWSHLHLCAKRGGDPYKVMAPVPITHPPDAPRMEAVLLGLRRSGYSDEADTIQARWDELMGVAGACAEPEYRHCFPQALLRSIVQHAYDGFAALCCSVLKRGSEPPLVKLLNDCWQEFWRSPADYVAWERQAVVRLRQLVP